MCLYMSKLLISNFYVKLHKVKTILPQKYMKIIDLFRILYPMVSYYPTSDSSISYGLSSDLILLLSKSNSNQDWGLFVIERGTKLENVLYFENEYIACLELLKKANKIISNIPNEMKVLDYREGLWFLLEQQQEFYFDVLCNPETDTYFWTIKLNTDEINNYRNQGKKSLDNLSEIIRTTEPIKNHSIFHDRKLHDSLKDSKEIAIIKFNQHREEHIKKYYKTFEEPKIPPQPPKLDILKKSLLILFFLFVLAIILQWSR